MQEGLYRLSRKKSMKQIALNFNIGDRVYVRNYPFPVKGIVTGISFEYYFPRGIYNNNFSNVDFIEIGYPVINYTVRFDDSRQSIVFYDNYLCKLPEYCGSINMHFVKDLYTDLMECTKESEVPF